MSEEGQLQQRTSGTRLFQLDALRGIAAVTVVVHHLRYAYTIAVLPWYFVPFEAGREAVDLFFVLSGFVLSIPLWNKRQAPYPEYVFGGYAVSTFPLLPQSPYPSPETWFFEERIALCPYGFTTPGNSPLRSSSSSTNT